MGPTACECASSGTWDEQERPTTHIQRDSRKAQKELSVALTGTRTSSLGNDDT